MNTPISIHELLEQPLAQVAALPVEQLATLIDEADSHMRRAQAIKKSLDEAVAQRYGDRASLVRN
ncbi:MAG: hypothetical protein HQL73_11150, partial [Magnetococcales bacterium]|nr:hypothetical protein [Magnetococcales bacterium]